MADIIYKEESFKIVGLCMKVHSVLGKGFKEIVYKDALEIELQKESISYEREKPFDIFYSGQLLKHSFNADFYIANKIILEAKATTFIHSDSFRQTLNYLKASQFVKLGIIVNFGSEKLEFKRIILTKEAS